MNSIDEDDFRMSAPANFSKPLAFTNGTSIAVNVTGATNMRMMMARLIHQLNMQKEIDKFIGVEYDEMYINELTPKFYISKPKKSKGQKHNKAALRRERGW